MRQTQTQTEIKRGKGRIAKRDGLESGDLEGDKLAVQTLQSICRQTTAPAAARAQAARTLLELSGALKNPDTRQPDKAVNEMTLGEIDEQIQRLSQPDTAKP